MPNQDMAKESQLTGFDEMIDTPLGDFPRAWLELYPLFIRYVGKTNFRSAVTTLNSSIHQATVNKSSEAICSRGTVGNITFVLGVTPVKSGGGNY